MLQYLNSEKTAACFNDARFSLAAPDDWTSIGSETTREAVMTWLALGNAPAPADIPPPPTALEQIRALEQAHEDDQRRLNRQSAIDTALTIMCRSPLAQGKTRAEVQGILYAANRGYRAMVDLESQIDLLRKQIV